MRTLDTIRMAASPERVFAHAADVEQWPRWLAHYRWVRFHERRPDGGRVEMSANRPFGLLQWPTWWMSDMWIDPRRWTVRYRHVGGITTGMDVEWSLHADGEGTIVTIVHDWTGPRWPLIRRPAADWVIGPVFIHGIASRTLAGIKVAAESPAHA